MPRILIVDDSALARRMLRQALLGGGHVVDEAPSAEAALERLATGSRPELVITNVNMDGLSGIELLKQIRTRWTRIDLPVLVLTTEHTPEARSRGRTGGANGWLVKPFDPEALLAAVAKVVASASAMRSTS